MQDFTELAVLGAGTMGAGIAQLAATRGLSVRVFDVAEPQLARARVAIVSQLERLAAKGKVEGDDAAVVMSRLLFVTRIADACAGVGAVIEAAPESMDLKVELFREVIGAVGSQTLLASNTSSLSITELGRRVGEPARTVGLHFFNPPPVMPLLEVVRGVDTAPQTVDAALALARQLGKEPIVVRDFPGFASSRLGVILGAEAIRMLEQGVASVEDIDRAMKLGYRHPMGPLELTDLVGLDVRLAILEHLHRELGEQFRPPALLRQMVRAGRLGKKSGLGFYRWTATGPVSAG
ncbi:MAG: 3-hydroxyacyl-CoA dehydrogenase family protein [Polyangiaceae bacterium]|nr:3-hydroxyacyl-CoA dehydrogenase family protein [Polyangiaceae bacterium]